MRFRPEIPVLPYGRAQAMALLRDSDARLSDVTSAIASDPGLTSMVLRAANAAFSAPIDRIGNVRDAVIRIGIIATRELAGSFVLCDAFTIPDETLDVSELWRHVVTTALLAEEDDAAYGYRQDAFTAGLLHDAGRMAMAAQEPAAYLRAAELARALGDARAAELEIFGVDHTEVGTLVARGWQLPADVVDAIANHHDEGGGLGAVVARARRRAFLLGIGDGVLTAEAVTGAAREDSEADTHGAALARATRLTTILGRA